MSDFVMLPDTNSKEDKSVVSDCNGNSADSVVMVDPLTNSETSTDPKLNEEMSDCVMLPDTNSKDDKSIVSDCNGNSADSAIKEDAMPDSNTSTMPQPPTNNADKYRDESDLDSWSEDDESSSSSSDTSSGSEFFQTIKESSVPKKCPPVKTKGELGLDDLPPIEDLVISVEEEEMVLIGKTHAVVEKLVVIHALKDMKPLDLDSVLFLSYDKPLGRVFDVFGPVVQPFYCVRFNSAEQIKELGIEIGADVFFAPEKVDITSYIFTDALQNQKGSDASWKDNNEPPEEHLDFSDDEKEKDAKRKRNMRNRNQRFSENSDVASKRPSLANDSSQGDGRISSTSFSQRDSHTQSSYKPAFRPSSYKNSLSMARAPFSRPNSFASPPVSSIRNVMLGPFIPQRPPPILSPSPSICSVMPNLYAPPPLSPSPSICSVMSNPFATPAPPPLSPSPSLCSVMSLPVRARTSLIFSTPRQPLVPFSQPQQSVLLQRPPPSPILLPSYPPPPVFGEVALPSPLPALQSPSIQINVPTFMPPQLNTRNYFQPRLDVPPPCSPNLSSVSLSPSLQNNMPSVSSHYPVPNNVSSMASSFTGHPPPNLENNFSSVNLQYTGMPPPNLQNNVSSASSSFAGRPSPILLNTVPSVSLPRFSDGQMSHQRPPALHTPQVPPNHPLTVQIPNASSSPVPVNLFESNKRQWPPFY